MNSGSKTYKLSAFLFLASVFIAPFSVVIRDILFVLCVLLNLKLIGRYFKSLKIKREFLDYFFLLLTLICIVQILKFGNFNIIVKPLKKILIFPFLIYIFIRSLFSCKNFHLIIIMIVISCVITSIFSLLFLYINPSLVRSAGTSTFNIKGFWGHHNIYAGHLIFSYFFLLSFIIFNFRHEFFKKSKSAKVLIFAGLVVIIINIFLTFSRGCIFIGFILGSVIYAILLFKIKILPLHFKKKILFSTLMFFMLFCLTCLIVFKYSHNRLLKYTILNRVRLLKIKNINLMFDREEIFKTCFKAIKASPIFGIGIGAVKEYLWNKNEIGAVTAHNLLIQKWLTLGMAGFLLYIALISYLIYVLFKTIKLHSENLYAQLIIFPGTISLLLEILRNMWEYSFYDSGYNFMFWPILVCQAQTFKYLNNIRKN